MRFPTATVLAVRGVIAQPKRFAAALVCTIAVLASAVCMERLAPTGTPAMLAGVFGGLVAFNNLMFFPPGTLWGHPGRIAAALIACLPLWLAPHLHHLSPVLAGATLLAAAAVAALLRPLGPPAAGLALLVTINLLVPLIMGAALDLAPVGAIAAALGTAWAALADAAVAMLLEAPAPDFERRLLRRELAGFLADLEAGWNGGRIWPDPSLGARIGRMRMLRQDLPAPGGAPAGNLPPDAILEAVERCAGRLRSNDPALSEAARQRIGHALGALGRAVRADNLEAARHEIAAIEAAATDQDQGLASGRVLGLALLLSDLIEAGLGRSTAT